jgi:hypothetical protein
VNIGRVFSLEKVFLQSILQIMYLYIDIFCPSCRESIKVLTLRDLPNAQNLAFQLHFGFWPGPNWLSVGLIGAAFSFTHTKKREEKLISLIPWMTSHILIKNCGKTYYFKTQWLITSSIFSLRKDLCDGLQQHSSHVSRTELNSVYFCVLKRVF